MSHSTARTPGDAGTLEPLADCAPMNAQLGTDLAQAQTLAAGRSACGRLVRLGSVNAPRGRVRGQQPDAPRLILTLGPRYGLARAADTDRPSRGARERRGSSDCTLARLGVNRGLMPNVDSIFGVQPETVAWSGVEGFVELVEVTDNVGPELRRCVGVSRQVLPLQFEALLHPPGQGVTGQEAAVDRSSRPRRAPGPPAMLSS